MNQQELLTKCEHALTEVDLTLSEWQEAVDFMSFVGQSVPMKLWVDNREVMEAVAQTKPHCEGLVFVTGKWEYERDWIHETFPLVRHSDDGETIVVGLAGVGDGKMTAVLSREHVGPVPANNQYSFYTRPEFSRPMVPALRPRIKLEDVMDFPESRRNSLKHLSIPDPENHSFFKEQ